MGLRKDIKDNLYSLIDIIDHVQDIDGAVESTVNSLLDTLRIHERLTEEESISQRD